jgi:DNA repair protein RecN (Recombination protein N)
MLTDLRIKNFAIIGALQMSFGDGLTVLTGETGAGKSIILGALGLIQGDRATPDLIRTGEEEAVVEAIFDIGNRNPVREKLREMGFDDGEELALRRIVSRSGKNRVFINGTPSTLGMLTSISESLINICGQREHQVFLNPDNHIDILDAFGRLLSLRGEYGQVYERYMALREKRRDLETRAKNRIERTDFLSFQLGEIDQAAFKAGEEEALQEEKRFLANIQKLTIHAEGAYDELYGREQSALEMIQSVQGHIREITELDSQFKTPPKDLEALYFQLEDLAFVLRDYRKTLVVDSQRQAQIEDRLELLQNLKRKYGKTVTDILERREAIARELADLSQLNENIEEMDELITACGTDLKEKARYLSDRRRAAALLVDKSIQEELWALKMEGTAFQVQFSLDPEKENPFTSKGQDQIEFYLSTNAGEALKPLIRIASGGELSRIILAMKRMMMETDPVGTMIFDEVDSGVGGGAAEVIGEKLRDLAARHQIFCITHLPQIACFGDHHFRISKEIADGRTQVCLDVLSEDDRVDEIARMMGGENPEEITREYAGEIRRSFARKKAGKAASV